MFVRDPHSGALINNEDASYKALIQRRNDKKEVALLKEEIEIIKREMAIIKELVFKLTENGSTNGENNT